MKGHFRDGVTRNEPNKAWYARIKRQRKTHPRYFYDVKCGGRESAHQAALEWYSKKKAALPAPTSTKGIKTRRNHSGIVGVHLAEAIQRKKSGACYTYWYWVAHWPGCPKAGGTRWGINRYGDDEAFVMAALSRKLEKVDPDYILAEFEAIRKTPELDEILAKKNMNAP